MTIATPRVPGFTALLVPRRSPGDGVALPDFEMRASMTTSLAPDSRALGLIAIESSSVKSCGSGLAVVRITASGMRGPFTARAKMNSVSLAAT